MHTLSSASRTCIASASAVECTATVATPSSLQARSTRSAISPRLAMRIFSNITGHGSERQAAWGGRGERAHPYPHLAILRSSSFYNNERFAVLDRLAVLDQNLDHGARA